jgi:hypothetical protein
MSTWDQIGGFWGLGISLAVLVLCTWRIVKLNQADLWRRGICPYCRITIQNEACIACEKKSKRSDEIIQREGRINKIMLEQRARQEACKAGSAPPPPDMSLTEFQGQLLVAIKKSPAEWHQFIDDVVAGKLDPDPWWKINLAHGRVILHSYTPHSPTRAELDAIIKSGQHLRGHDVQLSPGYVANGSIQGADQFPK